MIARSTLLLSLVLATGCSSASEPEPSAPAPEPQGEPTAVEPAPAAETEPAAKTEPADEPAAGVELTGTVIKKRATKSAESWNAGGAEYFVLDVGDAKVENRTAAEGVVLRPSDAVTAYALAAAVGKRVAVTGIYVEATPYTPASPMESYPTGMDGKPLPRGAGFQALSLRLE